MPTTAKSQDLTEVNEKLDKLLEFQEVLRPYLPMLAKLGQYVDNPASRFKAMSFRKAKPDGD